MTEYKLTQVIRPKNDTREMTLQTDACYISENKVTGLL